MQNIKTPKILPWIARKAGISEAHAKKLWQRATMETAAALGCNEGSAYHGQSLERFLNLVETAAGGAFLYRYADSPTQVSWIWRHQGRMAVFGLIAAENAAKFWQDTWSNVMRPLQAAGGCK